jgi:hypothetical protein
MKSSYKLLLLLPFWAACQPEPPMDAMKPMEGGCFVEVIRTEQVGFSDIPKFAFDMDVRDILFFVDKSICIQATAISYETVDPNGKPVLASGMIYHPINQPSKGVMEFMPIAVLNKDGGPSDKFYVAEGLPSYLGHTVLVPDLLGFGISKDAVEYPYLMAENTGRVAYDLRRAAAEYLWQTFQYKLPSETIIAGYSLGGFASIAAQKYYETHHASEVKIKKVFSGGGIYDLNIVLNTLAKTKMTDHPSIPYAIMSYSHYYDLDVDFSQIFAGELLTHWEDWLNWELTTDELREKIPQNIAAYMHLDFFKPFDEQNNEFKKLHPHFTQNTLIYGWKPKAPIDFTSAYYDSYLGTDSITEAVKVFRQAGSSVSLQFVTGNHVDVGMYFVLKVLLFALK